MSAKHLLADRCWVETMTSASILIAMIEDTHTQGRMIDRLNALMFEVAQQLFTLKEGVDVGQAVASQRQAILESVDIGKRILADLGIEGGAPEGEWPSVIQEGR